MITMLWPARPEVGEKLVIRGGLATVKVGVWGAVASAVVSRTGPVVAAAGTVASTSATPTWVKLAETPLKVTEEVPFRLSPWIRTVAPAGPDVGPSRKICGNPT